MVKTFLVNPLEISFNPDYMKDALRSFGQTDNSRLTFTAQRYDHLR
jgi:DNA polymerase III sliding clamp (beta) subunit (PCNA family)